MLLRALPRLTATVVAWSLALTLGTAAGALAQALPKEEPAPPLPADYDAVARRAYAQGLGEARELMNAKRYDDAIARLDQLLAARPREPQARFLRAVALADLGRGEDAMASLRAIVADYPELPEPRNNLAVLYAAGGNYALARTELELALATAPDYAIAHENLADVYARLAVVHYERAAALDPRNRALPQKLKLSRDLIGVAR